MSNWPWGPKGFSDGNTRRYGKGGCPLSLGIIGFNSQVAGREVKDSVIL